MAPGGEAGRHISVRGERRGPVAGTYPIPLGTGGVLIGTYAEPERTSKEQPVDDHPVNERFRDEDLAFLRHVRFGELPPRVLPADRVESTETEPRRDLPDPEPWSPQG